MSLNLFKQHGPHLLYPPIPASEKHYPHIFTRLYETNICWFTVLITQQGRKKKPYAEKVMLVWGRHKP